MAFEIPFGVKVLNSFPVDYYSGPYTASTIQDAINIASASIPNTVRFQSMEVRLIIAGVSKKYWYRDNTTDLVEFSSIGSGNSDVFYNIGGKISATNSTNAIYRNGSLNIGTGTASDSRFVVSSSGGTNSLIVGENGAVSIGGSFGIGTGSPSTKLHIFATQSGAFRLVDGTQGTGYLLASDINGVATWTSSTSTFYVQGGTTYSNNTTSNIYRTGSLSIGTGTASNSRFLVSSSGGTVSLFVSENGEVSIGGTLSSYDSNSQKSTLFVKGTTSSIIKVVGTGATWSNSASIFLIDDSGKVSIGATFSSAFSNSRLDINVDSFNFGVHTNGDYVTSKSVGRYAFSDSLTGMWSGGAGNIIFKSYGTGSAFKFDPQYTTLPAGYSNVTQKIILQEYTIAASSSNNQIRMIELSPTINKTGTASGIDIGLYIKPTLTNDLNKFRSIEVTEGDVLFSTTSGNVGIGLTAPSTKLHIYATQSGTAFRLQDGTQSYPGYVLTSDANGVGTWQGNTQVTITSATATALATWNNTTVMCNLNGATIITIPDTGLPPNFSFRFLVTGAGNQSSTVTFTYSTAVSILPPTLLTFAIYESGVIDRFGTSSNYYITY